MEINNVIRNLKLEGYRSFESYELRNLARVNLLVGKNNCGKTSILEAVHFLVSGGNPHTLRASARQRGQDREYRAWAIDISRLFGHGFVPGSHFSIRSDDLGQFVRVNVEAETDDLDFWRHRPVFDDDMLDADRPGEYVDDQDVDDAMCVAVRVAASGAENPLVFPATVDGLLQLDPRTMRAVDFDALSVLPVRFVPPTSMGAGAMRGMWNNMVREGRESEVVDALKLLERNLDSIHFLDASHHGRGGIVLGLEGWDQRRPIGDQGEGIRRLLALALSLTQLSGGVLLVDEIGAGLHWTLLADLWKLVIEQAARTNTQVFATTHSCDCIRGLASLAASHPQLATQFTVQKVERALEQAVGFDSDDVQKAVDLAIDLR